MRKNEQLIGIRPYQTSTGDWHLELTYGYEDKKRRASRDISRCSVPVPNASNSFS